jgi:DNA polymerase III delta prime subunit
MLKTKNVVALIHGPPGIGKTSIAHVALKDEGFEVYEINASLIRTKKIVQSEIMEVMNRNCLNSKKTAIILDEIDGGLNDWSGDKSNNDDISGKGAIDGVLSAIEWGKKNSQKSFQWAPIICISNEILGKAMKRLKEKALFLKFYKLYDNDMMKVLDKVGARENLRMSEPNKIKIIKESDGDVRRMMNLIQGYKLLVKGNNSGNFNTLLQSSKKDYNYDMFKSMEQILYNPNINVDEAVSIVESDREFMNLMLHENVPFLYSRRLPPIILLPTKNNTEQKTPFTFLDDEDDDKKDKNKNKNKNKINIINDDNTTIKSDALPCSLSIHNQPFILPTFSDIMEMEDEPPLMVFDKILNQNSPPSFSHNLSHNLSHSVKSNDPFQQSCESLYIYSDVLSEIDVIESKIPTYNEDITMGELGELFCYLSVLAIRTTRENKHIGVNKPNIKQQTFFNNRNEYLERKTDLIHFSGKVMKIFNNDGYDDDDDYYHQKISSSPLEALTKLNLLLKIKQKDPKKWIHLQKQYKIEDSLINGLEKSFKMTELTI